MAPLGAKPNSNEIPHFPCNPPAGVVESGSSGRYWAVMGSGVRVKKIELKKN